MDVYWYAGQREALALEHSLCWYLIYKEYTEEYKEYVQSGQSEWQAILICIVEFECQCVVNT